MEEDSGHNSFPEVEYPSGYIPDPLRVPVLALKASVLLCRLLPLTTQEKKINRSFHEKIRRLSRLAKPLLTRSLESWSCHLEAADGRAVPRDLWV